MATQEEEQQFRAIDSKTGFFLPLSPAMLASSPNSSKALLYNKIVMLQKKILNDQKREGKKSEEVTKVKILKESTQNPTVKPGSYKLFTKRVVCRKEGNNFGKVFTSQTKVSCSPDGCYSQEDVKNSFRWSSEKLETMSKVEIKHGISKKESREYVMVIDSNTDEPIVFIFIDEVFPSEEEMEIIREQEEKELKKRKKVEKANVPNKKFKIDIESPPDDLENNDHLISKKSKKY